MKYLINQRFKAPKKPPGACRLLPRHHCKPGATKTAAEALLGLGVAGGRGKQDVVRFHAAYQRFCATLVPLTRTYQKALRVYRNTVSVSRNTLIVL